jgi:hypothetical protein
LNSLFGQYPLVSRGAGRRWIRSRVFVFELSGDERLYPIGSVADAPESGLQDISVGTAAYVGQNIRIFAAGEEPAISQFSMALSARRSGSLLKDCHHTPLTAMISCSEACSETSLFPLRGFSGMN